MARSSDTRLVWSSDAPGERRPPRAGSEKPAPDAAGGKGLRLRLDRRASGRVVTLVTGLPGTADEVAALARELRSACGAGGTVKGGVLERQGDHRDRVEAVLAERGLRSKRAGG